MCVFPEKFFSIMPSLKIKIKAIVEREILSFQKTQYNPIWVLPVSFYF